MAMGIELIIIYLALMLVFFLVGVLIIRWALRINEILNRLDSIINALQIGFKLEEIKRK